jgi:hypothetical protein
MSGLPITLVLCINKEPQMREALSMSKREREISHVLQKRHAGMITVAEAAAALHINPRHVYRLQARYLQDGDTGLIHGLAGKPSNRGYPERVRRWITELYQQSYPDYGPVLFSERLRSHHRITVDHETLRRWLVAAGLWKKARKGRRHRKKRERRDHIGAMTQVDGSFHAWFEDRGAPCCLFVFIDDASNQSLLYFAPSEDTEHALRSLRLYIERYGIMHSIYSDRGSVFGNREEETSFSRAVRRLGIEMIYAHSPQAKGRVERANRTHQDRLVKALRENNICDIDTANRFLFEEYLDQHNGLFAHRDDLKDIHRPAGEWNLDNIICVERTRHVYKDMTIRDAGQFYQILPQSGLVPVPRQKVAVRFWLDGSMHVFWKEHELAFAPFTGRVLSKKAPPPGPPQEHPWRKKPPIGKAKGGR